MWSENTVWASIQAESIRRIHNILGTTYPNSLERIVPANTTEFRLSRELDKYGLGKERTIEEYWSFALIDPVHRAANETFCNRGLYGHD